MGYKLRQEGYNRWAIMELDIHGAVQTTFYLTLLSILLSIWAGVRAIQSGQRAAYFSVRRRRVMVGWRFMLLAIVLMACAVFLGGYAEPVIYRYFPPSPTPSLTPSVTLTPTITETPTITLTPSITLSPAVTYTPTIRPTPFLPLIIEVLFESSVTPNPDAAFSELQFSQELENAQAVDPQVVFQNPVGHLYAAFSYDQMIPGVQWTALWYRGLDLVFYETKPWDGAIGGYGYTDWNPLPEEWIPGEYEVQIFVGMEWKVVGRFRVEGDPPTPTP